MEKQTISLIIDDSAPVVNLHWATDPAHTNGAGAPMVPRVPDSFLGEFCDLAEEFGLAGKFSVIPMVGGQGDILHGYTVAPKEEVDRWIDTVKRRLSPRFSFCPEMLTHKQAVDLATGEMLPLREDEWASTQDRETLTPYIARALTLLKEAGIRAVGVTSPWVFGIEVEDEYARAVSEAVWQVWGEKESWYFCRSRRDEPGAGPWVAYEGGGRRVVSIPATTHDWLREEIEASPDAGCDEASVLRMADRLLTEDGSDGQVARALGMGSMPVILTHWPSLFSNGTGMGLRALRTVARRIEKNLKDRVVWRSYEEIMRATPW